MQIPAPHYALEGSIAITGALVQWVRDNLDLIEKSSDIEALARHCVSNSGRVGSDREGFWYQTGCPSGRWWHGRR